MNYFGSTSKFCTIRKQFQKEQITNIFNRLQQFLNAFEIQKCITTKQCVTFNQSSKSFL